MKKIFLSFVNEVLILKKPISIISIEDPTLFRKVSLSIEENIIYSVNDVVEPIEKRTLFLYNPFELNLNEARFIKALYKQIESEILNKEKQLLIQIEKALFYTLENVSEITISPIEYNSNIDIGKLLSSIGLNYKKNEDYLENLNNYIKIYNEIMKNSLIISFGLTNLLSEEEIYLLSNELLYLNIFLLDIRCDSKKTLFDVTVDKDWCIV